MSLFIHLLVIVSSLAREMFLNSSSSDIFGALVTFFAVGGFPEHYRTFRITPELYGPVSSPQTSKPKCLQTWVHALWEAKFHLFENHWPRELSLLFTKKLWLHYSLLFTKWSSCFITLYCYSCLLFQDFCP